MVLDRLQPLGDAAAQAVGVEAPVVQQGEGPQRQGHALAARTVADPRQLQTGAAHVGGHAARAGVACQHAQRGIFRFFLAAEDADAQARLGGYALAEFGAVLGLTHGGGGGDQHLIRLDALDHGGEAAQRRHGHDHARLRQAPGGRQVATEAGQGLLVEDGPDRPAFQAVDDQAHRVGADVDDGDLLRFVFALGTHQRRFRGLRPG
uniref:LigA n=1 Tax=Parastrongyloides trichosuri TaxID=131310 RepID=A0A0N4ZXP9_PARTI